MRQEWQKTSLQAKGGRTIRCRQLAPQRTSGVAGRARVANEPFISTSNECVKSP